MLALLRRLVDEHPEVTDFRKQLAFRHNSLAKLLLQTGKLPEAEAESRQALAIVRKLVDEHPGDGLLRREPGGIPQDRRQRVVAGRQAGGGGGGIPPGAGDRPGTRRQPPRRPRAARAPGGQPRGARWVDVPDRARRERRRPSTAGGWRSCGRSPRTIPPIPDTATSWQGRGTGSGSGCGGRTSRRRRRPSSARRWRFSRSSPTRTPWTLRSRSNWPRR